MLNEVNLKQREVKIPHILIILTEDGQDMNWDKNPIVSFF